MSSLHTCSETCPGVAVVALPRPPPWPARLQPCTRRASVAPRILTTVQCAAGSAADAGADHALSTPPTRRHHDIWWDRPPWYVLPSDTYRPRSALVPGHAGPVPRPHALRHT